MLDRRAFLASVLAGAAALVGVRLARRGSAPGPAYLSRGAGGIWGFTHDPLDAEGALVPGSSGVLVIAPRRCGGAALMMGDGGIIQPLRAKV